MASDEQIDAVCRRLQRSREEILVVARVLKGGPASHGRSDCFPRSRIMRALTGEQGQKLLGSAALALAMSRPRTVWRLAALRPLLRPVIIRFLVRRLFRSGTAPESTVIN